MASRLFWILLLPLLAAQAEAGAPRGMATSLVTAAEDSSDGPPSDLAFRKPAVLRGSLGAEQIRMRLYRKPNGEEGIAGHYVIAGQSRKILLAGEAEGDEISFEESINGSDVSGQWIGNFDGDMLSGTWEAAGGALTKPFTLRMVRISGTGSGKPGGPRAPAPGP